VGVELKKPRGLRFVRGLQQVEAAAQQRNGFGELRLFGERSRMFETLARFPVMFLARLQTSLDGLAAYAQQCGSRAFVATGPLECAVDQEVLGGGEFVASFELQQHVGEACARHRCAGFVGEKPLERVDVDERVFGEHAQLADEVAQLPDVPRPGVLAKPPDGGWRKFKAARML
jgi:hypothetical protein